MTWDELLAPSEPLFGLTPEQHAALQLVRVRPETHAPMVQVFTTKGRALAPIPVDADEGHGPPKDCPPTGILADDAGAAFLAGTLPERAILMPADAPAYPTLKCYAFSAVRWLVFVVGAKQLVRAARWTAKPRTQVRYAGMPIVGIATPDDYRAFEGYRWPDDITVGVATQSQYETLAAQFPDAPIKVLR